jgi:hypothetical protein
MCGTLPALAQDYGREQRWAEEILPTLVVGEAIHLQTANGHRFLALYTKSEGAHTAIVLVHGIGVHPDHSVIGALRQSLADAGYSTLSIQMPVLASEAPADEYYPRLFPEAGERIELAAQHLRKQGYRRVVLLSHSLGSWMSNVYLAERLSVPYDAWISLGRSGTFQGFSRIGVPVLDVYAEHDLAAVREYASRRRNAISVLPRFAQAEIAGADHFYTGKEKPLTARIVEFLRDNKF